MIYLRHRESIFCLFLVTLAGGTVGDSEAARWERENNDWVRWAQEPFCTIPTRYGTRDDWPLAVLNLPEVEAGTDSAASGVYPLLPESVQSWLERLGIVASGRFTCDFELHCTLHRQETCCKKVPGKRKLFAHKQVPTRSVVWLDYGCSDPQAAVKFIPLFPKGSGITFDVQADQKEGPRVASLPHGFLLRKFPQSFSNSEKTLLWWKVSLRGRKSDQPFFFAVLIFSPNRVIVHLELLPADNFDMDQDLANWESLLLRMLGDQFLENLDRIPPLGESVSIPSLSDGEIPLSRPIRLSLDRAGPEQGAAETAPTTEEEEAIPANPRRVSRGNFNSEDAILKLLDLGQISGENLDLAEILPRCFLAAKKGHFLYLQKVFQRATPEQWASILRARAAEFTSKSEWIKGETLLHFAAQSGHILMVKLLLEKMPFHGINAKKAGQGTPLHAAAEGGNAEIAELLLNRGASVNAVDCHSWTPLHRAIVEGHSEIVRLLLARGADPTIPERESALHYAVWKGNTEIVRLLLENLKKTGKLAHIQAPNSAGRSPLYKAAEGSHAGIAKLLLEYGAHVDERCGSWTVLHCAAEKGCCEMVEMLLDRGADLNAVDGSCRETPLSVAARSSCTEVIRLLLARHADVRIANNEGNTPLHHAAQGGASEIVPMLLRREDIGVDARNGRQETPLHLAAGWLQVENVRALLEKGANPNATNNWDETPLHYVVWPEVCSSCVSISAENVERSLTILRLLLDKGADINALENDRRTPLQVAVGRGNGEIIRLLLKEGAAFDVRDEQGKTPLHMAVECDDPNYVYLLLEKGADGTSQTARGFTPLHRVIYDHQHFGAKGACRVWIKTEIATAIGAKLRECGMQGSDIFALLINDTFRRDNGGVTFDEWKACVREDIEIWYRNLLSEWGIDVDALLATPALSSPSTAMPSAETPVRPASTPTNPPIPSLSQEPEDDLDDSEF
ncbi:MAG: ankyrin repeat domain-containing protein [Puniceicoccales bacterium]|nr:ankyrin repeat domain-containing protein [Puniceicoccales bacterium]